MNTEVLLMVFIRIDLTPTFVVYSILTCFESAHLQDVLSYYFSEPLLKDLAIAHSLHKLFMPIHLFCVITGK